MPDRPGHPDAPRAPLEAARVAVLGDLSGHLSPLLKVLADLGVVFDGPSPGLPRELVSFPDDLAVVQVGDLVHKGPVSELVLAVVHDLLLPSGRWVQLAGNHEVQYLPDGPRFWRQRIDARSAATLEQMWEDGRLCAAVAVDDVDLGPVLVSHAGISPARFDQAAGRLRREGSPVDDAPHVHVAAWLNRAPHDPRARKAVFTPGAMAGRLDEPGVAWTEPHRELRLPWQRWAEHNSVFDDVAPARSLPFSQVHGHAQPLLIAPRRAPRVPSDIAAFTDFDRKSGHVTSRYPSDEVDRVIVGIDPGANDKRAAVPRPLLLSGRVHL